MSKALTLTWRIPSSHGPSGLTLAPKLARSVSSSPYGRTHVWATRKPKMPNPVVPSFMQRVTRADGSTFIHRTTSPRAEVRLTRDVTNNPLYNNGVSKGGIFGVDADEGAAAALEDESSGMSRFKKRFDDLGRSSMAWINELNEANIRDEDVGRTGRIISASEAAGSTGGKKKKR
ncbi:hypothetical protein BKA62DRAFT_764473 [Auriculariales sp. MPI-PUGE-AT-0066]|nr:hypothetical protein BKA62DRAFT_764473 [Auriculariales sp. MPI-PUGE-AT-0066]